jgi:multidrug transporter EmrE-like cation transporter
MKTKALTRRQAVGLMFLCTLLGAAGQILIKYGAGALRGSDPLAMLLNLPLMAGYSLYGLMTVLFVFALRDEELSILYPIIALTYVWVALLSIYYFHETLNAFKLVGISVIVIGVGILGRDGRK